MGSYRTARGGRCFGFVWVVMITMCNDDTEATQREWRVDAGGVEEGGKTNGRWSIHLETGQKRGCIRSQDRSHCDSGGSVFVRSIGMESLLRIFKAGTGSCRLSHAGARPVVGGQIPLHCHDMPTP